MRKRRDRNRDVVARTADILRGHEPPRPAEELRVVAEDTIADDVIERSGGTLGERRGTER
jgi:hypothetical protein